MFYSEHSWNWADGDTLSLKMGGTCVFFRPISWIRLFLYFWRDLYQTIAHPEFGALEKPLFDTVSENTQDRIWASKGYNLFIIGLGWKYGPQNTQIVVKVIRRWKC